MQPAAMDYGVPFISVSQPTENSPAGRMMRRTLANMASFYTEQQSLDVQEGLQRRVHEGWFIGKAPYGYKNIRINGRSVIQIDDVAAKTVKRIFHVFAYENVTLDDLMQRLKDEGLTYRPSYPYFARSKVHTMLRDRSYIGEVPYRNEWLKGNHEAIIERDTWNRAQTILGHKVYRQNELTYAGGLIVCGHCGHAITGEQVTKKTKAGENRHNYYRCTKYLSKDHPRIRLREADLDEQILKLLESIKIEDEAIREWFGMVLRSKTRDDQEKSKADKQDLARPLMASGTSPSEILIRKERSARVRTALEELPTSDREVLVMRHLECMSVSEIAATLEISESAVKMRRLRAVKKFKDLLSGQ